MAEWTSVARQVVNPGEAIVFTETAVPCPYGLILHREDSGAFLAKGIAVKNQPRRCCCLVPQSVTYKVSFGANIAVPEGETVGPISVAIALDGNTLLGTEMEITPAAVEEFGNVSRCTPIGIWKGCCQTVSVRNTSAVPIAVENANLGIEQ